MSAKSSSRTQNASFSILNSVLGVPSFGCLLPQMVTAPFESVTTICPSSTRLRRERTRLRDRFTNGPQVTDPACARITSKVALIAEVMGMMDSRTTAGFVYRAQCPEPSSRFNCQDGENSARELWAGKTHEVIFLVPTAELPYVLTLWSRPPIPHYY